MSNYSTTGAKNGRDYGARHPVLRDSIVLHHGCVLAYGQRAPRAPRRKCRRIGGRYFNREKSGDVAARTWVRTGSYRPRIRAGYVVFFKKLFGSPAGFGFERRAAEFECEGGIGVPEYSGPAALLPCFGHQLDNLCFSLGSEYTCAHSCLRCNSLFAPAKSLVMWPFPLHIARSSSH